ncbi:FMN-binding glutamate synthase family protein [Pedobacter africanus]|uniref:Glutamate synthase domain-containing protein 2 n=1 Tax=Pedobacter africanus TaxID=151894 RepID=A0A1W1ZPC1_9SPHI|nr:FMN-binding glutamate synthase family protein [Pedobacter africanus]SMC50062.1 Glutamate synthase domain-containing protein 2 [Pedobacter africanus]
MENQKITKVIGKILLWLALTGTLALIIAAFYQASSFYLLIALPLILITAIGYDRFQSKHAVLRNYPVVGRLRYFFEAIRPEMRQYFFESDLDGKPFNRRQRSIVYQRAKNERETVAFGMQVDPYQQGYEWVSHSIYPKKLSGTDLRVMVGNHQCSQPYSLSILNIGAMSFGALSRTAIMALNHGAKLNGFAHNTGEGGISPHHVKGGADLIWQIGTGYFGCRDSEGNFDPALFQKNSRRSYVKMIEIKLSQGAKPGHGGILPAAKNTAEIAEIRSVQPGTTVISPPAHSTFNDATGLMHFVAQLRELSEGKPVGFKLCIGSKQEFLDICTAMLATGICPDFITIDGAEGGTGAAPLEYTDYVGMPLLDALAFVSSSLTKLGLRKQVKILASGKIITGFDIMKAMSLGADACYSARGMMMALGCIQALKCDSGKCPVGIATQDKSLYKGIDVTDKKHRVANFHKNTLHATAELMEACGFGSLEGIRPEHFHRRIDTTRTMNFKDIYFGAVAG